MPLSVRYKEISSEFHHPFTISKGTKTHQPALLVELSFRGKTGYGEAPAIAYYNIPVEQMIADLEAKKIFVEKFAYTDPERYWHYLHHLYPRNPFLVCALDMASWDLYGKLRGKPLYELWNLHPDSMPLTDYTIGLDTVDKMIEKMKQKPWPVYKIKVGVPGDVELVKSLREQTDALFRVDANAGWSLEEAEEKIPQLNELGVELIEQPLAKDNWEGMKKLYSSSPLPLYADESCVSESDVQKCKGHFHGINIKLTKCSGITPALRMIKNARELGLKIMIGSMNETTIGSAAIGQLSPMVDFLDMDGPLLLKDDAASGLIYDFGKVSLSEKPGLGVEMRVEFLQAVIHNS
jgi:L-alanine-DL-glutamate epimerase-like enolase superfamily enzyme